MGCCDRILEVINITVVPGVSLTLEIIPNQQFKDYGVYELEIPQALPPMVGTEAVFILAGATTYYTLDRAGNILRAGRLRGHRCGTGRCGAYRIIYGSDGIISPDTGAGLHFEFICGLDCMKFSAVEALLSPPQTTTIKESVTI